MVLGWVEALDGDAEGAIVDVLLDPGRDAHCRYAAAAESLYLIRPDGYVAFRGQPATAEPVLDYLGAVFASPTAADRRCSAGPPRRAAT